MSRPKTNGPNFIDVHVGNRMRTRRMMFDMSLEKMGKALGLTLQQVHEYEKGKTSIGSSRLQQAASILAVPVSFFFETDGTAAMPSRDALLCQPFRHQRTRSQARQGVHADRQRRDATTYRCSCAGNRGKRR
jgi:transcriptional regulator with XRE-family HTH domain